MVFMRIEVIRKIDDQCREKYCFNLFDFTAVLVGYFIERREKGKIKWLVTDYWDMYRQRESTLPEPEAPCLIYDEAKKIIAERIKVMSWKEWKSL
jgi:hypothetical protein